MNDQNGIYCWLLLGAVGLTGCQDQSKEAATHVECRVRPPASEIEPEGSSSHDGMSFGGFRLGEVARVIEDQIAERQDWIGERPVDCDDVWFVRAGTTRHAAGGTMCDVHGPKKCELVQATMKRATPGLHVLTNLTYTQRLEKDGRPTRVVLAELKASHGEPLWTYAARRSAGWPQLIEETHFIWSAHGDKMSGPALDSNFQEEVIKQLGAGDFLIVTLIHQDNNKVTYAMIAELRRVSPVRTQK